MGEEGKRLNKCLSVIFFESAFSSIILTSVHLAESGPCELSTVLGCKSACENPVETHWTGNRGTDTQLSLQQCIINRTNQKLRFPTGDSRYQSSGSAPSRDPST